MLDFLAKLGTPTIIVATKIDKVAPSQRAERIQALAREAGVDLDQVIPFSAVTGTGRDELAEAIVGLVRG
jgi:GTP-binding protein